MENKVETQENNQEVDYKALYEETNTKLEERDSKVGELEGLIQKHKKDKPKDKTKPDTLDSFGKEDFQKMLEDNEFYKSNPEMSEHKEVLEKYTSNGNVSLAQAKLLVLNDDTTIQARQTTKNSNFTSGSPDFSKSTYTKQDLENASQSEYNKIMVLKEQGKVTIT